VKKLLVPLALTVVGVGAGVGAGVMLRPDAADAHAPADAHGAEADTHAPPADAHAEPAGHGDDGSKADGHAAPAAAHDDGHGGGGGGEAYVSLGNQFIVPILDEARVKALVVVSIDLEVGPGGAASVYRVEPKIRDAFLTVLFDHANAGGFNGTFTSSGSMDILRAALREAGRKAVGDQVVSDVLITGIVRQDV
jgi:hypothetical protein